LETAEEEEEEEEEETGSSLSVLSFHILWAHGCCSSGDVRDRQAA
jgi:hypothetical protein